MYKTVTTHQISFFDFNQSCGLQLDPNNDWILRAQMIPWQQLEQDYLLLFPSDEGNPAKAFRLVLGARIIQLRLRLSDRQLVKTIQENPYLQFFIGLPTFQSEKAFAASSMVSFRKRLDSPLLKKANELMIQWIQGEERPAAPQEAKENLGTVILDATCSPSNVRYPTDTSLLNEARLKLEAMIDWFYTTYAFDKKPRTYRRVAHKDYLVFAKSRKPSKQKIRAMVRKQLNYVKRDLGYLESYMTEGFALSEKFIEKYLVILSLYDQQLQMFTEKTHQVEHRLISLSQPFLRPIVRGKAKAKTEFGAKYDVSLDTEGFARLEKLSFEAYNESTALEQVVEDFKSRTGSYPERILVDQIYRTRANRSYCKSHGIRMSGPKLGRQSAKTAVKDKKTEKQDQVDRIAIERFFSLGKRGSGLGLIMTKLPETTESTITLGVMVANLFAAPAKKFFILYFM